MLLSQCYSVILDYSFAVLLNSRNFRNFRNQCFAVFRQVSQIEFRKFRKYEFRKVSQILFFAFLRLFHKIRKVSQIRVSQGFAILSLAVSEAFANRFSCRKLRKVFARGSLLMLLEPE